MGWASGGIRILFLHLLHLAGPARALPRRLVRTAAVSWEEDWLRSASASGGDRGARELLRNALASAGLEHAGHQILQVAGRRVPGRVADGAVERRRAAQISGAETRVRRGGMKFGEYGMKRIKIIGAGLAGTEAAYQCARRGIAVELYEMRPVRSTPAHQTSDFAELVCSNSLTSESENSAPWVVKEEMRRAGSLLLNCAREAAVPAGHALAVDRDIFSKKVTEAICNEPLITVHREEVTHIDDSDPNTVTVIAT